MHQQHFSGLPQQQHKEQHQLLLSVYALYDGAAAVCLLSSSCCCIYQGRGLLRMYACCSELVPTRSEAV